jgi:murein DD-endopeptidase MepM/ murein hydrolase activator NlpD
VLRPFGVTANQLDVFLKESRDLLDPRKIRPNQGWLALFKSEEDSVPAYFIYEKTRRDYVVIEIADSLKGWTGEHPAEKRLMTARGSIENSLYQSLQNQGADAELAMEMAAIYAWTIDFYRLQKGDQYEVLYEQEFIDDQPIGGGVILAAHFIQGDKDRGAYRFENNGEINYFGSDGASLKKAFLKAPVKFSRISSNFSGKRFHPVLKRYKAHLGTDYAAPHGTPILAVGDGVVTKSGYTGGNGNYVKIRHNGTYETQYLHMSKRAVKEGERVQQGEVIGYVGSTGLATGPHVCFRFWKNGVQVDHLREDFPNADPLSDEQMPLFLKEVARYDSLLQSITGDAL